MQAVTEGEAVAAAAGLVYADDSEPGIRREGAGAAARFLHPDGAEVTNAETLERIRGLAIPPAYTDVWISPDPRGHIQATGRDARGRKQYRYHPAWQAHRDETKFARMAAFGRALPRIRAQVDEDLARRGLPKDKAVAAVVRLLERTLIRVGNDEYARTNKSFGLTTLRNRHVRFVGDEIRFSFKGKSGVKHATGLRDRRLARIVRQCQDVPGQRLFQYYDADGGHQAVESADVNAYLRAVTGGDFTAKDFRTWAGTVAAAKALSLQPPPASPREAKALIGRCVAATAGLLGNTPAVCRSAYIHPGVLDAFHRGALPKSFATAEGEAYERRVLKFLDGLVAAQGDAAAAAHRHPSLRAAA
jgi:DNA topoisomerase-1